MSKKILVLYTSVGLGHKFIAMNMVYHLEHAGYEVKSFDVLQLQEGWLVNLGKKLHEIVNKHFPFVWRWLYMSKGFTDLTLPMRIPAAGKNYQHIKKAVNEFQPDAVIAVQTTASAAMAYMKQNKEFNGKFIIGFSDYHLHRYWLYDQADFYLANIPEQKEEMVKLGIPAEKIEVCGITLKPELATDKTAVRNRLGIQENEKVILLASGSLGIGFSPQDLAGVATNLLHGIPSSKVIIVCGKNEAMKEALTKMNIPGLIPLGFYEPMAELYSISNVFLTKPGGLTIAEALRSGVNIVITHWLPGQEELNYNYLLDNKLINPKVEILSRDELLTAVNTALSRDSASESAESLQITQKNHEGQVLLDAIKKVI